MIKPPNIDHDERRRYFLAFGDAETQRDLGACVVEVSGADAMIEWIAKPDMHNQDVGPWLAAAIREAWAQGCNPGGQVMGGHITQDAPAWVHQLEVNRLYSDAEMIRRSQPN
jgi:hypothetical protein